MLRILIFFTLLITVCGYAIWRGGKPERLAGIAFLLAVAGTAASYSDYPARFGEAEVGVLVVDSLLWIVLFGISLKADRGWPLALAGLQLATVCFHIAKLVKPDLIPVAYAALIALYSYPMLLLLAVGVFRHQRRLKKQGYDLDWSLPLPKKNKA